jgi:putative phosphoesterase
MKIALLSDAHGNAVGLRLCLEAARELGADEVHFLGDAIGYMPEAAEVLELLHQSGALCVLGNHEAMLIGKVPRDASREPAYRHEEARRRLGSAGIATITGWPEGRLFGCGDRRVLLVHGSPQDPLEGRLYPDTATDWIGTVAADLVAVAHTHHPFVRRQAGRILVNVGSCGMPRDEGNALAFAIYDAAAHDARIYRIRIDTEALLRQWSDGAVHEIVGGCFRRRSFGPVVGTFLDRSDLPWTA